MYMYAYAYMYNKLDNTSYYYTYIYIYTHTRSYEYLLAKPYERLHGATRRDEIGIANDFLRRCGFEWMF